MGPAPGAWGGRVPLSPLGPPWAPFGPLSPLGGPLGPLGAQGAPLGPLGAPWSRGPLEEAPWGPLGKPQGALGPFVRPTRPVQARHSLARLSLVRACGQGRAKGADLYTRRLNRLHLGPWWFHLTWSFPKQAPHISPDQAWPCQAWPGLAWPGMWSILGDQRRSNGANVEPVGIIPLQNWLTGPAEPVEGRNPLKQAPMGP